MCRHLFLNFFACRLCWRRESSRRDCFFSLGLPFFWCLQRVVWIHGLVFILRTYGWFSCLGRSTKVTSTLCSYGVKLTTSSCHCRRNPTVENVDTFFLTQPDPFVRVFVKYATLTRLGIQNDSMTFTAHFRCRHQCFVNRCHSEIHATMQPLFRHTRNPSSCTDSPVAVLYNLGSSITIG